MYLFSFGSNSTASLYRIYFLQIAFQVFLVLTASFLCCGQSKAELIVEFQEKEFPVVSKPSVCLLLINLLFLI